MDETYDINPERGGRLERLELYICQGRLTSFTQETIKSFSREELIDFVTPRIGEGVMVAPAVFTQEIYQLADEDRCAIIRINYE